MLFEDTVYPEILNSITYYSSQQLYCLLMILSISMRYNYKSKSCIPVVSIWEPHAQYHPCIEHLPPEVLSWIDEGKLPEANLESARAVKNSLSWHFQPEVLAKLPGSQAAVSLCKWMVAVFAYFDAVENWEP